jgi:hypothetical protein
VVKNEIRLIARLDIENGSPTLFITDEDVKIAVGLSEFIGFPRGGQIIGEDVYGLD